MTSPKVGRPHRLMLQSLQSSYSTLALQSTEAQKTSDYGQKISVAVGWHNRKSTPASASRHQSRAKHVQMTVSREVASKIQKLLICLRRCWFQPTPNCDGSAIEPPFAFPMTSKRSCLRSFKLDLVGIWALLAQRRSANAKMIRRLFIAEDSIRLFKLFVLSRTNHSSCSTLDQRRLMYAHSQVLSGLWLSLGFFASQ